MYSKGEQLTKESVKKKLCKECDKNRDLKFFTSTRAKFCIDCTRSKAFKKRMARPAVKHKHDDAAWSLAVKDRDGNRCAYCGSTKYLNSHHIFSRTHQGLRWDLDNGITLCSEHHTFSTKFSAHKTPMEFTLWIMERNGKEWYERLRAKAGGVHK